jgi:hypothetical protein
MSNNFIEDVFKQFLREARREQTSSACKPRVKGFKKRVNQFSFLIGRQIVLRLFFLLRFKMKEVPGKKLKGAFSIPFKSGGG